MQFKRIHYLFAGLSFLVPLITYLYTMQPSIPFWDCGEFASAAFALQVPHPPGSPLWTIIGRLAMMLPTFSDMVARYNFFSVLSSAATVWILYLTVVRLIKLWRGEPKTMADSLTSFGGALIAALCYTFTDSFWFNALECEVYAFGSLFIALIPYIMLVWYDHEGEEHSEKYLLLAAYVTGLSLGVHQLALLNIFPCFMLIYYKRRKVVTAGTWIGMVFASIIAFFISYKLVLSWIVEWLGNGGLSAAFVYLLFIGTLYGIYWSQKQRKPLVNLSLWSALLIFMGFSTYYMIMVRAAQEPPMNQWHANDFKTITKFINRDQYGYRPPWPRQVGDQQRDPKDDPTFTNYSGNWDFLWRYQVDHMFNRYFAWNFIGRVSQDDGSGADWTKTFGLPFFLGLFGMYWHFKRDPKRGLTILAAFIFFGWATALYQNQQDPQPRERDYFYVGAFYFFAMWVGIGATGIMEWLRSRKQASAVAEGEKRELPVPMGEGNVGLLGGALAAIVLLVPLNQCAGLAGMMMGKSFAETSKWHEYSRAHNNIPFEAAYNSLQSCEPNAILFTAGDNDTFPLWAIQDCYGIRRDIRIVNLSLGNMSWYIKQLKKDVWDGAGKKIDLPGFSDQTLNNPDDAESGVHGYIDKPKRVSVPISAEAMRRFTGDPNAGPSEMSWTYRGEMQRQDGMVYMVADQLVKSIVEGNINSRPIYFASAVPPDYQIGVTPYLVWEGMAQHIVPVPQTSRATQGISEKVTAQSCLMPVKTPFKEYHLGYLVNTFTDPAARWSNSDRTNFAEFVSLQRSYLLLAQYYINTARQADAKKTLDKLVELVPPERVMYTPSLSNEIAKLYVAVGDASKAERFSKVALSKLQKEYEQSLTTNDPETQLGYGEALMGAGKYEEALPVLQKLRGGLAENNPYRGNVELRWQQLNAVLTERKGDKKKAVQMYDQIFAIYGRSLPGSPYEDEFNRIKMHVDTLKQQLGMAPPPQPPVDTAKKK
jgi:hypothetical protein